MFDIENSTTLTELAFHRAALKTLDLIAEVVDSIMPHPWSQEELDNDLQSAGSYMETPVFEIILEQENAKLQEEVDAAIAKRLAAS